MENPGWGGRTAGAADAARPAASAPPIFISPAGAGAPVTSVSEAAAAVERCFASPPCYAEEAAGVPADHGSMTRLGDLLEARYRLVPARAQLRRNLAARRAAGLAAYPGVLGFGDTVEPAVDRALLAGHDMLLVGQVGQAKTLLARTIAATLLSAMPVVRGSATSDCPMDLPPAELAAALDGENPAADRPAFRVSPDTIEAIGDGGLETRIEWRPGADRFRYVLATPDLSVKDLVGHVDVARVARRGAATYSVESYSPGQLMQAKHGLLCIDELPVLDPKKQVALLSVLQEGVFTTGAFPVAFEPRTVLVATANPVDYTHSGRIVEPLSDRLRSHIRTHYPRTAGDEAAIVLAEACARAPPDARALPSEPAARIVAGILAGMRASPHIDQARGVSTRIGIHGLEALVAEAERARGMAAGAAGAAAAPRLADLHALWQAAKFDLAELDGTDENRREVFSGIVDEAVRAAAAEALADAGGGDGGGALDAVRAEFEGRGGGDGDGDGDGGGALGAPVFRVSQRAPWEAPGGGGGDSGGSAGAVPAAAPPYSEQLARLPALARMAGAAAAAAEARHGRLCAAAGLAPGSRAAAGLAGEAAGDARCMAVELLLEALRWSKPKVLDRRDGRYVAA